MKDALYYLGVSAYAAYSLALRNSGQSHQSRKYYERCSNPQIGDLVLETTAFNREYIYRIGYLRSISTEPYPDQGELQDQEEPLSRPVYKLELLYDNSIFNWENCKFITIPVYLWEPYFEIPEGTKCIIPEKVLTA